MENSSQGLTLLDPDRKVVVTGEEHHQPALSGYAPGADGRPRRVAVELRLTRAGRVEVLLDGWRVGELTALMSQRYGGHVDAILRRGGRPGAVGLVVRGRRGVEVELRLPEVASDEPVDTTSPLPPVPPSPGPDGARPRGRFRTPLLVGGGVVALLLVIGSVAGGEGEVRDTATPAIAAAVPARPAPTTTVAPTIDPDPTVDPARDTARVPAAPVTREPETRTPDPEPVRDVEPAPEPEPVTAVSSDCHPSYSPCLPNGPDLDCGDIDGPVTVTGPDDYRLDREGDGIGCES